MKIVLTWHIRAPLVIDTKRRPKSRWTHNNQAPDTWLLSQVTSKTANLLKAHLISHLYKSATRPNTRPNIRPRRYKIEFNDIQRGPINHGEWHNGSRKCGRGVWLSYRIWVSDCAWSIGGVLSFIGEAGITPSTCSGIRFFCRCNDLRLFRRDLC